MSNGVAKEKFQRGLREQGYASVQQLIDSGHFTFGLHGTSIDGIKGIFEGGFDTARRRGQKYGRGEYFDLDHAKGHTTSFYAYASGNNTPIIALLITKRADGAPLKAYNEVPDSCWGKIAVVDNPTDGQTAFVMPLLLVGKYKESVEKVRVLAEKGWKEYSPDVVAKIRGNMSDGGTALFDAKFDGAASPYSYQFRFDDMLQKNTDTGKERRAIVVASL